jgi:cytidine deaminase
VTDQELYERAVAISERAYARYSRFQVGAAVLTRKGAVVLGVNVENAAYPLGICAERAALARAIAEGHEPGDFLAVAVNASPCGGCRQWLHELGVGRVVFPLKGEIVTRTPAELLPDGFDL